MKAVQHTRQREQTDACPTKALSVESWFQELESSSSIHYAS